MKASSWKVGFFHFRRQKRSVVEDYRVSGSVVRTSGHFWAWVASKKGVALQRPSRCSPRSSPISILIKLSLIDLETGNTTGEDCAYVT